MADTREDATATWRLRDPVVGYLIALFLSTATLGMAYSAGVTKDTVGAFVGGQLGFWAGLMLSVWLASAVSGVGRLRDDYDLRSSKKAMAIGAAIGVGLQWAVLPLLYLPIGLFVDDMNVSGESRKLLDQPGWTALLIVGVVLVAPVIEELFFRGLLLNVLRARVGIWPAVIGSAVVFGLTHYQLLQLPGLVVAGITFAVLRVRTGSLGPSIAAHVAFNAATVALLYA